MHDEIQAQKHKESEKRDLKHPTYIPKHTTLAPWFKIPIVLSSKSPPAESMIASKPLELCSFSSAARSVGQDSLWLVNIKFEYVESQTHHPGN